MSHGDEQLVQGRAITRFLFSAAKRTRFAEFNTGEGAAEGEETTFCRRVFCQSLAHRQVCPADAQPCQTIAAADAQGAISFSEFSALPFHLQRWLRVDLTARQSGAFAFRLGTCGGVRVWRDGAPVVTFTPFTRNQWQFCDFSLTLSAGKNRLLIHLDELAERETLWGMQMVYLGTQPLGVALSDQQTRAEYQCCAPGPVIDQNNECASRLLTLMQHSEGGPYADTLLAGALRHVSAREECSVFSLLPLLQLWRYHYGEYFPAALWRRVRSTLLGYRYGADERGCDVMRFHGENHALAFSVAQYLAGQLFPDARFIASGRTGREQQAIAAERLAGWFAAAEAQGLHERGKAAYYPTDYPGLWVLQQMADDVRLRERAGRLAQGVTA